MGLKANFIRYRKISSRLTRRPKYEVSYSLLTSRKEFLQKLQKVQNIIFKNEKIRIEWYKGAFHSIDKVLF